MSGRGRRPPVRRQAVGRRSGRGSGRRPPIPEPAPVAPRYPWLVPLIAAIAIVIVVAGIVWAIAIGAFFTVPTATPSPS